MICRGGGEITIPSVSLMAIGKTVTIGVCNVSS